MDFTLVSFLLKGRQKCIASFQFKNESQDIAKQLILTLCGMQIIISSAWIGSPDWTPTFDYTSHCLAISMSLILEDTGSIPELS